MASKTAGLAKSTERLAKLTEQDVALSRTAIEADIRPVLITVPRGAFVHERNVNYDVRVPGRGIVRGNPDRAAVWVQDIENWLFVSAPVRNEGAGIAFDLTAWLQWQRQELEGEVTSWQVPPHEFSRASFAIGPDRAPNFDSVAAAGAVVVNVNYVDLAGNLWASRLTLKPTSPQTLSDWYVSQLEVTGEGRIPPYAQGALEHL